MASASAPLNQHDPQTGVAFGIDPIVSVAFLKVRREEATPRLHPLPPPPFFFNPSTPTRPEGGGGWWVARWR